MSRIKKMLTSPDPTPALDFLRETFHVSDKGNLIHTATGIVRTGVDVNTGLGLLDGGHLYDFLTTGNSKGLTK